MEKVITLLKDLSLKVAAEGKKDAAQYDKYSCFCKEQADEKLYAIEKSDAKIADLKAEIGELESAIAELNSEISDLSKKISALEDEIDKKTKKRATEHELYSAKANDMNEAVDACAAAIKALKDSKKDMKDAKVDLVQITHDLIKVVQKQPLLANAAGKVALLSKVSANAAPKFEYQSNDIIATLEDLLATFKSMKKDLDQEEFDVMSAFEKNKLALSNEKKFAEQDKAEKETIVEAKTERLEAAKSDRDNEQADRNADDEFMKVLTSECETKAALFDKRSSTRADEMKALSEATAKLESGAVPNFSANKKLVGLQKTSKSMTFLQMRSVEHHGLEGQHAVLQRLQSFLSEAAGRTGSQLLSTMAARVNVAEDHFVKVRGLIKDLIAKLKADAEAEADQKSTCDKGMASGIADRDEANAKIEKANAQITTLTANQHALEDEIDTLNKDISDLKKSLLEATELRAADKAENTKTMSMTEQGADAVKSALEILKGFYDSALMQTGKYVPPNSDRDGNTVGDLAPETFKSEYHGAQAESEGIVGILEVILSDFDRSNKDAENDEKEGLEAYEKFEKDTNDSVDRKNKRIGDAEGELSETKASILEEQQALSDAEVLLKAGLAKLEALEAMCVKGEESFAERKQKRLDEIEALKNALNILEEWQN